MLQVVQASDIMGASVKSFAHMGQTVNKGADEQTERTRQMVEHMESMRQHILEIADNAEQARKAAAEAESFANQGGEVLQRNITSMAEVSRSVNDASQTLQALKESSDEIGEIIGVIKWHSRSNQFVGT